MQFVLKRFFSTRTCNFGQQSAVIMPHRKTNNKVQGKKFTEFRVFGSFKCTICKTTWQSANAYGVHKGSRMDVGTNSDDEKKVIGVQYFLSSLL